MFATHFKLKLTENAISFAGMAKCNSFLCNQFKGGYVKNLGKSL